MACIIYYQNLDYDKLPTSRKKIRLSVETQSPPDYKSSLSASPPQYETPPPNYNSLPQQSHHWEPRQNQNTIPNQFNQNSTTQQYKNPSPPQYQDNSQPLREQQQQQQQQYQPSPPSRLPVPSRQPVSSRQPVAYKQLIDALKRYFQFSSFRENQLEAVNATCQGLDTLVLMPTGGGKSICYQLPAILSDGLTVVVSPLRSLIDDQVTTLRTRNVRTSALSGDTPDSEVGQIFHDLRSADPEHKMLYVTPEKINCSGALMSLFSSLYERGLLTRFVIDEAHCVSMWGADFRPDYRKLGKLRELYPDVPIMALTATAPPKVRDDIYNQLKMNKRTGKTFIQSFNRANLKFEVRTKNKGCIVEICNLITKKFARQCGIIYCLSRNDCESVAEKLREQGVSSSPYHAGLSDTQRKKVFKAWSNGVFQVVCATIAFGMGIDKSDVRFVIHYSVPKSVEGYYQEAGRAGRDGELASCILYFSKTDVYRMRSMLSKGFKRKQSEDKNMDQSNLEHMIAYVENRTECRRTFLLRYLGEEFNSNDCISHITTACDNCLARKR